MHNRTKVCVVSGECHAHCSPPCAIAQVTIRVPGKHATKEITVTRTVIKVASGQTPEQAVKTLACNPAMVQPAPFISH
jgi:hypothetical protein